MDINKFEKKKKKLWDWKKPTMGKSIVLSAMLIGSFMISWKVFIIIVFTVLLSALIFLFWLAWADDFF